MRAAWRVPAAALGTAAAVALIAVTVSTLSGGNDPAPRSLASTPTASAATTSAPPATTAPAPAVAPTASETPSETPAEAASAEPAAPVETVTEDQTVTEDETGSAAPAPAPPTYAKCDPGFLKLGPGGFSGFGSGGPTGPEISGSFEANIRAMAGFPELCPDASVPVFWATYGADGSGVSRLYASGVVWLTPANQTVYLPVVAPRVCRQSWFIGNGDQIASSFGPGEVPYEGRRILWNPPVFNDGCVDQ